MALIQETKIPTTKPIKFSSYHCLRYDRPPNEQNQTHGGVAILIHRRHSFCALPLPSIPNMDIIAATISVYGTPTTFVSLYNRPLGHPFDHILLSQLFTASPVMFVAGDWNAKHTAFGCRVTNNAGASLLRFIEEFDTADITLHLPTSPTHISMMNPTAQPDILDYALSVGLAATSLVDVIEDLSSDHLPVLFTLVSPNELARPPPPRLTVKWRTYHDYLSNSIPPLPSTHSNSDDMEAHIASVTAILQSALADSTTLAPPPRRSHLPPEISLAISERRRLRKRWQITRAPADKNLFNRASNRCSTLLKNHRLHSWEEYLSSLPPQNAWQATKKLLRKQPPVSPIDGPNGLIFDENEKVEKFASHLEHHFSNPPHDPNNLELTTHFQRVKDQLGKVIQDPTPSNLAPFTMSEFHTAMGNTNPKKAAGLDGISGKAILNAPPELAQHLLIIFNSILHTQHFPAEWKKSKLFLLLKPGKGPTQPSSYRPISIPSIFSKLFEKMFLEKHLKASLDSVIRPEQFGFRAGCSTTLQLMKFCSQMSDSFNKKEHAVAVFIDFKAAFDTVWIDGLLFKLSSVFPPPTIRLFKSYLTNRYFSVHSHPSHTLHGVASALTPTSAGVPQGSVLGPILYSIFINDMPSLPLVTTSLFADDTTFHASSMNINRATRLVQGQLDHLTTWCSLWKVEINPTKCVAVAFSRKRNLPPPLTIHGHALPWSPTVKYLGITIDRNLSFKQHVDIRVKHCRVLFGQLFPLLITPCFPLKFRLLIFTAIIRAYMTYAAPVWFPYLSASNKQRLIGLQNRIIRTICNFHYRVNNTLLYEYAQTPLLLEHIQLTSRNLHDSASMSWRTSVRQMYEIPRPVQTHKPLPFQQWWPDQLQHP